MSYKIGNGFRFKASRHADVVAAIERFREELRPVHREWLASAHAAMCADMIDAETVGPGANTGKVPLDAVKKEFSDRTAKMDADRLRDPDIDQDFKVYVYRHPSGYYGIVQTERGPWEERWMSSGFVEDFAYWDNSDMPDDIEEREWDRRRLVWTEIIDAGVSEAYACTTRLADLHEDEVARSMPSFENRLARQSRRIGQTREMERREMETRPQGRETDSARFDRLWAICCSLDTWINGEGRAAAGAIGESLRGILKPTITAQDLAAVIRAESSQVQPGAAPRVTSSL